MIIFFGPAGAGKSVQGQILAARHGWRWLSAGQLLRDSRDPKVLDGMLSGELIESEKVNARISEAITRAESIEQVILDGYPRTVEQAQWLVSEQSKLNQKIQLVVVLDVSHDEIIRRLKIRGRVDDNDEAIEERLNIYHREIPLIVSLMSSINIPVVHIQGKGTVGQVHDQIEAELVELKIVKSEE
jgi:adenylate kinase